MIEPRRPAVWLVAPARLAVTGDSRRLIARLSLCYATAQRTYLSAFPDRRLKMKKTLFLAAGLLVLMAATGSLFAQSTDRDHPTPFRSNEINGELKGEEI
jgi:hypothetical protein